MRISKHLHSCLLIQHENKTIIIDPGSFTYQEEALNLEQLSQLDYILITHEHPDHMSVPLIKKLLAKFPKAMVISNPSIQTLLGEETITVHTDLSSLPQDAGIRFEEVPHGKIFDLKTPQHILFELFGTLTHPGDSINFDISMEILALPLLGPSWAITQAAEKALAVKPKVVIPIHDYHWRDSSRKEYYKRLAVFFGEKNIEFKPLECGEDFIRNYIQTSD